MKIPRAGTQESLSLQINDGVCLRVARLARGGPTTSGSRWRQRPLPLPHASPPPSTGWTTRAHSPPTSLLTRPPAAVLPPSHSMWLGLSFTCLSSFLSSDTGSAHFPYFPVQCTVYQLIHFRQDSLMAGIWIYTAKLDFDCHLLSIFIS